MGNNKAERNPPRLHSLWPYQSDCCTNSEAVRHRLALPHDWSPCACECLSSTVLLPHRDIVSTRNPFSDRARSIADAFTCSPIGCSVHSTTWLLWLLRCWRNYAICCIDDKQLFGVARVNGVHACGDIWGCQSYITVLLSFAMEFVQWCHTLMSVCCCVI